MELGISEVDGTQTQFLRVRNEPTVVTLCFKRHGKTLPSNASQVTCPGNTVSNYTVKLPKIYIYQKVIGKWHWLVFLFRI